MYYVLCLEATINTRTTRTAFVDLYLWYACIAVISIHISSILCCFNFLLDIKQVYTEIIFISSFLFSVSKTNVDRLWLCSKPSSSPSRALTHSFRNWWVINWKLGRFSISLCQEHVSNSLIESGHALLMKGRLCSPFQTRVLKACMPYISNDVCIDNISQKRIPNE